MTITYTYTIPGQLRFGTLPYSAKGLRGVYGGRTEQ
jgi:hypothetical protein